MSVCPRNKYVLNIRKWIREKMQVIAHARLVDPLPARDLLLCALSYTRMYIHPLDNYYACPGASGDANFAQYLVTSARPSPLRAHALITHCGRAGASDPTVVC